MSLMVVFAVEADRLIGSVVFDFKDSLSGLSLPRTEYQIKTTAAFVGLTKLKRIETAAYFQKFLSKTFSEVFWYFDGVKLFFFTIITEFSIFSREHIYRVSSR